jgi:hypothetical protein
MSRVFLIVSCLFILVLGGCIDNAPAYEANLLTNDPGLAGSWIMRVPASEENKEGGELRYAIAPRTAKVTGNRLGQFNPKEPGGERDINAYLLTVTLPRDEKKPDEAPKLLTYDAVLLTFEGTTLLAFEPSPSREPEFVHLDYLPVHRILRLERNADEMTVRLMRRPIVWLPGLKPLDREEGDPMLPTEQGTYFVADPDRLVRVLAKAVKEPEVWDKPLKATRVK